MIQLRRLNQEGMEVFRAWLKVNHGSTAECLPAELIDGLALTEVVSGGCEVPRSANFVTKREAATWLHQLLDPLQLPDIHADGGLWSWLAAVYFENLTVPSGGESRKVLAQAHYVFDPTNSKRRYRHLLHTPFQLLAELPDNNRLFLDADVSVHGDLVEQTMGRLYVLRLPGVRAAIDRLYFDRALGRIKRGAMSSGKSRRGDLRHRLPMRIRQLEKTYDLAALNGDQLIALMGPEFSGWL
jgi:hypothetical protein